MPKMTVPSSTRRHLPGRRRGLPPREDMPCQARWATSIFYYLSALSELCRYLFQVHHIVRRQGAGPCVPSDVSGFAPFAMLAFLVAATSGSVNLLNAANGAKSQSREGRRRRRRDLLGMLWLRFGSQSFRDATRFTISLQIAQRGGSPTWGASRACSTPSTSSAFFRSRRKPRPDPSSEPK